MYKIAIVGSTGVLGQPVTKAFIEAGFEVTVLSRNPTKTMLIFGSPVRIVKGDLKDKNSLKELLERQDFLYINLSVEQSSSKNDFQPERDGIKNLLDIAKLFEIKRIGYLSSLVHFYKDIDWWVFNLKKEAVKQIKQSGISYSIFYPSTFMESFSKTGYRLGSNINLAGTSKYKMYLISGLDYGKQVVKAFESNNGNHEYVVQGQEGFTADEAAKLFADNYKKAKIKVFKIPFGILKFLRPLSNKFNYAANIVDALNNYPEKFEAETTWQELGKPETKFIDYIKSA